MTSPTDLKFTKDHEWARVEGGEAVIGITDHAQNELGDITFIDLPPVGRAVAQAETLAEIESVKAASQIYAPVSGEVVAVNEALADAPEKINAAPYGEGWIARLRMADPSELDRLMDAAAYEAVVAGQGGS